MSNMLSLVGRRSLLSTRPTARFYSTVDSEPPRRSNKWLILGSTALLGVVGYRYVEAQRREQERAKAGAIGRTKQDTEARLETAKKQAGDIYDESKRKVDSHSKDVAAAKDSLIDTTKKEASNVSSSVRDAASHIAGEADTLYGQAKKVVNDEKDWIKKEYEHTKHTLGQEKEEIKREADRFAAEHHLKEGDTPTDIVVAGSRGERNELAEEIKHTYDQTKGRVLSEKERLEREAKGIFDKAVGEKDRVANQAKGSYYEAKGQAEGSYYEAKGKAEGSYYEAKGKAKGTIDETKKEASGFWASLTGKAQEKKAEVEDVAHNVYDKAVNEKDHLEHQAKNTYNEAKQQASGLWSDAKGTAEQKKREAGYKSDEIYNKALYKKNEFELAGRKAADEAKSTFNNAKGDAERKANEAKWRAQTDADYVKAKAEGKKNEAASTLGSIINATKDKINDTFDTRPDGRRPASVIVAEQRPSVVIPDQQPIVA
ncbi:hypothetical protein INT44_004900 [Umbelopsis vinacea]|uniref:Uncharacterized protein n=1 Tax=Umbelopsis vinacea TaxID=44442 RepID=A0A8H7Q8M5_9FUNG|nr:hypothetical protein INT44_004900 [Umbelopsis vinacea]